MEKTENIVVRKEPRMSVNSFADYNHANASKKEKTIIGMKYPKTGKSFGKYRNKLIKHEIHEFICSGDLALMATAEEKVNQRDVTKDWHASDNANCMNSIASLRAADLSLFKGYDLVNQSGLKDKIQNYEGLKVSILPRILLYKDGDLVGGIITRLTISKLKKSVREDVGLMLYEYLTNQPNSDMVERKLCFSINVPHWEVTPSPNSHVRRLESLNASARMAVLQWAAL